MNKNIDIKIITRIAVLAAISLILTYIRFPITFIAPSFLELDISDVPAMIASFAVGPLSGVLVCLFKNILEFMVKGSQTGGIGELSNFFLGSIMCLSIGIIYKQNKTFKNAIIGLILGIIMLTAFAVISNYYIIFPLYSKILPMTAIINMGHAINNNINSLWSMMIYAIIPFNLIKGIIESIVCIIVYKKINIFLKN